MNFIKNIISFNKVSLITGFKLIRMSCPTVFKNKFFKFHKLFTNWFFGNKKMMNVWKQIMQIISRYPKGNLVVAVPFCAYKGYASSKSFYKINKAWKSSVVKRKNKFIKKILSIFYSISIDTNTAFSIDKSRNIRIVEGFQFFRSFNRFKKRNIFFFNQATKLFKIDHLFNEYIFSCFARFPDKVNVTLTLFCSLFEKWKYCFSYICRMFSKKHIAEAIFFIWSSCSVITTGYCTSKMFLKKIKHTNIGRCYNKLTRIFKVRLTPLFSKIKTAISIDVPTKICKNIFICNHENDYSSLSHKVTDLNTPTELTSDDIFSAVQTLLNNDAKMISKVVSGSTKIATQPTRPAFWGIIDTALLDDLESVSTFNNAANYAGSQTVLEEEWGSTRNVRWMYTSVGTVSTDATPVYTLPILGQEAYATVQLGSQTGEFYVEPLGSGGSADPLHQRGSVGKVSAHIKPNLIDLEAYGESYGDRGEPNWDAERLSGLAA